MERGLAVATASSSLRLERGRLPPGCGDALWEAGLPDPDWAPDCELDEPWFAGGWRRDSSLLAERGPGWFVERGGFWFGNCEIDLSWEEGLGADIVGFGF